MKRFENILMRHWFIGTTVAFCGLVLARVVAPGFSGRAAVWLTLSGQLLAISGLFTIALGVRRRVRGARVTPEQDSAS